MTTLPEEAVKAAAQCYLDRTVSINETASSLARAMLTAAAPHLAPVRVKKLEWELASGDHYAEGSGTHYNIYETRPDFWNCVTVKPGNVRLATNVSLEAAKAAAQADYEARIIAALEPAATCNESLQVEPAAPEAQLAAFLNDLSGENGELIDRMAAAIRDWGSHYDDGPWETLPEDRKAGWRGDAKRALEVVKEYLTTRALSSPDHADAGKVEGDEWNRELDRFPTLQEAAQAAKVLMACHGRDLSVWSDDFLPCSDAMDGLNAIIAHSVLPSAPASESAE